MHARVVFTVKDYSNLRLILKGVFFALISAAKSHKNKYYEGNLKFIAVGVYLNINTDSNKTSLDWLCLHVFLILRIKMFYLT